MARPGSTGERHRTARRPGCDPFVHAVNAGRRAAGSLAAGRRYGRRIHVLHLTDGELGELLCSPFAETELVRSDGIVVAIASPDDSEVHAVALEALVSLPCIVVGHGHSPADRPPYVDVVVDDAVTPADGLLTAIEANPIASVTLAMVLRGPRTGRWVRDWWRSRLRTRCCRPGPSSTGGVRAGRHGSVRRRPNRRCWYIVMVTASN